MKSKDELNAIKNEAVELGKKISELNDEELNQVVGGSHEGLPQIEPHEKYIMTIGVKADGGVAFKQENSQKEFEYRIYDEVPSNRKFDPPKFIG